LSHYQYALVQMELERVVTPLPIPQCANVEEIWSASVKASAEGGLVTTGDRVWFRPYQANKEKTAREHEESADLDGMIERVEPRHGILTRASRGREQVLVANVDQVVIVMSLVEPELKPHLVDRYLASAAQGRIAPVLCLNKADLVEPAGKNTAPAIALATSAIERPEDEVMIVLPADHWIDDEEVFRSVVRTAAEGLAMGAFDVADPLVTLGIVERPQDILNDLLDNLHEGEPFEAEATALRKDGTEFEVELQITPVRESAQLQHWVLFVRDVTSVKQQLEQLRRQTDRK